MPEAFTVAKFVKDMKDEDMDIRQMGLYDLNTNLEAPDFTLADSDSRTVVELVLTSLGDRSSQVRGIAVRSLPILVHKVAFPQIERILNALSVDCLSGKKETRDIGVVALKTVIAEIPDSAGNCVKQVCGALVRGYSNTTDKADVLDAMNDILKRFGSVTTEDHAAIQAMLLGEIEGPASMVRKKAILCLASLSTYSTQGLFSTVVEKIMGGVDSSVEGDNLQKYIQLCSAVSRCVGHRLGHSLDQIMPKLVGHCRKASVSEDEQMAEIRENIIQAFESFTRRCPQQVTPFFPDIVAVCKEALQWDPNYSYESEDEEEACDEDMEDMDMGSDDDMDDMDQDDDDDDTSWKVRKAASKCLSAIITSRGDMLDSMYLALCSKDTMLLPDRFKEREEGVRLDVFSLFLDLLSATKMPNNGDDESSKIRVRGEAEKHLTQPVTDFIVKRLLTASKEKSLKIKVGVFQIFKELAMVMGKAISGDLPRLVQTAAACYADKGATLVLKTEILGFIREAMAACPKEGSQLTKEVSPCLFNAVKEKYHKIVVEGVKACGEVFGVVSLIPSPSEQKKVAQELFDLVFERLNGMDVDQDTKEAAIVALGRLAAEATDSLSKDQVTRLQASFAKMMDNDMVVTPVVRSLSKMKKVPMEGGILKTFLDSLGSFMRKSSRTLRQSSLLALRDLLECQPGKADGATVQNIITSVTGVVDDSDLHLSSLALQVLTASCMSNRDVAIGCLPKEAIPRAVALLQSPLLQGQALKSSLGFFSTLSSTPIGGAKLRDQVLKAGESAASSGSRQSIGSVARIVAAILKGCPPAEQANSAKKFLDDLSAGKSNEVLLLSLHCLGEMGRVLQLDCGDAAVPTIQQHFKNESEEVKSAAALAWGRMAAGQMEKHLPSLIAGISRDDASKYLTLRALRDMVVAAMEDQKDLSGFSDSLLPVLLKEGETEEEGVRSVVGECLGKMAVADPNNVLGKLHAFMEAGPMSFAKTSILIGLKYTINEGGAESDRILSAEMPFYLGAALVRRPGEGVDKPAEGAPTPSGPEIKSRRAGVLLFTAAAHNKPALVQEGIVEHMNALYAETPADKRLIYEIPLGPFKHKVDEGVETRKAAFECLDLMLDAVMGGRGSLLEFTNDFKSFVDHLIFGLKDEAQDIKTLSHLMLAKLARLTVQSASLAVVNGLPAISERLAATLTRRLKSNAVQQEKERHNDLRKSALRAAHAIARLQGAKETEDFGRIMNETIPKDAELREMFKSIMEKEGEESK